MRSNILFSKRSVCFLLNSLLTITILFSVLIITTNSKQVKSYEEIEESLSLDEEFEENDDITKDLPTPIPVSEKDIQDMENEAQELENKLVEDELYENEEIPTDLIEN